MPFTAVIQPFQMKNVLKEENLKAWPEKEIGIKTSFIFRRAGFLLFSRKQAELFYNVLSVLQTFLIQPVITCRHSVRRLLVIY